MLLVRIIVIDLLLLLAHHHHLNNQLQLQPPPPPPPVPQLQDQDEIQLNTDTKQSSDTLTQEDFDFNRLELLNNQTMEIAIEYQTSAHHLIEYASSSSNVLWDIWKLMLMLMLQFLKMKDQVYSLLLIIRKVVPCQEIVTVLVTSLKVWKIHLILSMLKNVIH